MQLKRGTHYAIFEEKKPTSDNSQEAFNFKNFAKDGLARLPLTKKKKKIVHNNFSLKIENLRDQS